MFAGPRRMWACGIESAANRGLEAFGGGVFGRGSSRGREGRRTLDMNRPKMAPIPAPATPDMTSLVKQDSMPACICEKS